MAGDKALARIERQFKERHQKILEEAQQGDSVSMTKIDQKIREFEFADFERRIASFTIPGDEEKYEKIKNDINVYIDEEINIPNEKRGNCVIIVKFQVRKANAPSELQRLKELEDEFGEQF